MKFDVLHPEKPPAQKQVGPNAKPVELGRQSQNPFSQRLAQECPRQVERDKQGTSRETGRLQGKLWRERERDLYGGTRNPPKLLPTQSRRITQTSEANGKQERVGDKQGEK